MAETLKDLVRSTTGSRSACKHKEAGITEPANSNNKKNIQIQSNRQIKYITDTYIYLSLIHI